MHENSRLHFDCTAREHWKSHSGMSKRVIRLSKKRQIILSTMRRRRV